MWLKQCQKPTIFDMVYRTYGDLGDGANGIVLPAFDGLKSVILRPN